MAEEHRCQAPPEGPRLCANNCGFFGSPATLDLCSKCYLDYRLKEQQQASAKKAVEQSLLASASASASASACPSESAAAVEQDPSASAPAAVPLPPAKQEPCSAALGEPAAPPVQPGRCTTCRKRVGLTGFRCRCGATFCGTHRYPERHGCTFDFKTAGREALARANPVVKAEKLDKI